MHLRWFCNKAMASYESLRSTAYSEDHRWRIVYQRKVLDYSVRRVAENLGVSPAIEELFDRTSTVSKQEYPEDHNHAKKLTPNDEFLILQLAIDTPGIQLHEIQIELPCSTGTCVITSRLLYKSGFTRNYRQWHSNAVRSWGKSLCKKWPCITETCLHFCIYQDILPWVANCSVYTQEDKSPISITTQVSQSVDCQHKSGGKNYTRK